jgi:hypothetical protein
MYITELTRDSDIERQGENFVAVCVAEAGTLGLTNAQVSALQATQNLFSSAMTILEEKIREKESATAAKDQIRDAYHAMLREYARQFRANNSIPDALLSQLSVAPHKVKGTRSVPAQPLRLIANPDVAGNVFLMWDKNDNNSRTIYQIESNSTQDKEWRIVGTTNRGKFTVNGNGIGRQATFRVIAIRRGIPSLPSMPVTIFASAGNLRTSSAA